MRMCNAIGFYCMMSVTRIMCRCCSFRSRMSDNGFCQKEELLAINNDIVIKCVEIICMEVLL